MKNVLNYVHDPNAKLDYGYGWEDFLEVGETITAVTAVASAPSATLTGTAAVAPDLRRVTTTVESTVTTFVTFHITTSAGRQDERTIRLLVTDR